MREHGAGDRLRDDGLQGQGLRLGDAQLGDLVETAAGDLRMGDAQPVAAGAVHVAQRAVRVEHAHELRAVVDQAVGQALALQRTTRAQRLREQPGDQRHQADGHEPEQPQGQGDRGIGCVGGRREHGCADRRAGQRDEREDARARDVSRRGRAHLCVRPLIACCASHDA